MSRKTTKAEQQRQMIRMSDHFPSDVQKIIRELAGPSAINPPNPYRTRTSYGPLGRQSPEPKFTRKTVDKYNPLLNQRDIELELQRQKANKAADHKEKFVARSYIGRNRTYPEQIDFLNEIRRIGRDNDKYYEFLERGQTQVPGPVKPKPVKKGQGMVPVPVKVQKHFVIQ